MSRINFLNMLEFPAFSLVSKPVTPTKPSSQWTIMRKFIYIYIYRTCPAKHCEFPNRLLFCSELISPLVGLCAVFEKIEVEFHMLFISMSVHE